jgi:hypothetical protein
VFSLPFFWRFIRHPRVAADAPGTDDEVPAPEAEREQAAYYPPAVWGAMVPPGGSMAAIDEDVLDDELRKRAGTGRVGTGPESDGEAGD